MKNKCNFKKELKDFKVKLDMVFDDFQLTDFSKKASSTLKVEIKKYASTLVSNSHSVSRQQDADSVSKTHVDRASEHISHKPKKHLYSFLNTIGGILLGFSLTGVYNMFLSDQISKPIVLFTIICGVIGAFFISLRFTKG